MQIVKILSETKFYGSNLGISIFTYVFILAGGILCCAVIHQRRPLAVLSYNITIMNLIFFMLFYDLDMYRKLPLMDGVIAKDVFGSGVITGLINAICFATIIFLLKVIKRLRGDYRYLL
ncbi:hypothetical protein [Butyrivibrio sp. AE2015]|uniref:hypothetical protein n=1 Tax=Butyrivibrio sp. AE2015 TaxID=1280663 RepID=UPI0003B568CC|nr:hypothetical protein [Butyrivibrio sp. AE2015]